MEFSDCLRIGGHQISRMRYDQIEAGDIVVNYEALTTRPDLLAMQNWMRWTKVFNRPELKKMLHVEVVLQTYPRSGVCRVAHAEGLTRKICIQEEQFKTHHPGQALLIFRAKDPKIRKEIANVATQTAAPGNEHLCKTVPLESYWQMLKLNTHFFLCANSGVLASRKTLRNIAHLVVNFEEDSRFYDEQGSGAKEMRCVEYVANVVNTAAIRVLFPLSPSLATRQQKINEIFFHLKEINSSQALPLKLSHQYAIPPMLAEFFLTHQKCFQTVGYLGAICERIEGPILDIRGEAVFISPTDLSLILQSEKLIDTVSNSLYARKVMCVLGMIQDGLSIYLKSFLDPIKNQVLYIALIAKSLNLTLREAMLSVEQKKEEFSWPEFYRNVRNRTLKWHNSTNSRERYETSQIKPLPHATASEILLIEKECIKSISMERTDRTLKLSLNTLALRGIQIERTRSIARSIFDIGQRALKTIVFSPLTLGFRAISYALNRMNERKERVRSQLMREILTVHEKVRKNSRLSLQPFLLPGGHRPWMQYSTDEKTSWDVEPFIWEGDSWNAYIHMPISRECIYRLFVGPEILGDTDPVGKALAWEKRGPENDCVVDVRSMKPFRLNETQYLQIGAIENPVWFDKLHSFQRNDRIAEFRQNCNEIALTRQCPSSIAEFEKPFERLEATLPRTTLIQSLNEDFLVDFLITFLENQLDLSVLPRQIQFMDGGYRKGLSGDRIYKILDSAHRPLLIVKVFMNSRGKFLREFHSLENHNQLELTRLNLPHVLGIGSASHDNRVFYFLAMDYIPGKSLESKFSTLSNYKHNTSERREALGNLLDSYAKLGKGMREFHSSTQGERLPLHPVFANLLELFGKNTLIQLKQHLDPILWNQFNTFFHERFQKELQKNFLRGYLHGDLNAGNLIDNPMKEGFSVLDWPDGAFSIGKDGEPMGVSFYDVIQVRDELLRRTLEGITEDEIESLYQAFLREYMQEGLELPLNDTWQFFSAIDLMGSVTWFLKKQKMFEPERCHIAQEIYRFDLQRLTELTRPVRESVTHL
jgi:hypothetical protein